MLKFAIFTVEGSFLPIALKLQSEGNEVIVAQVHDKKLLCTDEELKNHSPEDPEAKKRRLSMYDGMIKKQDALKVLKAMKKSSDKDYIVMTESNSVFRLTEAAQKMGYTGLIPLQQDREWEVDRQSAKEVVKKNYPDIEVMESQEFTKVEDGIKFLEEQDSDNVYVLKSLGDSGETVVPKTDDPEACKQLVIDTLNQDKGAYEQNGFLLEQKILDAVEITPEMIFWDGEPVCSSIDIETKTLGGSEKGPNYGCLTNLIVKTELDDKINKMAFPKYVHDLAKTRKGMFIIDAGLLFDRKTGKAYFTEYCSNRLGWDSFPTDLSMCGDQKRMATPFFEKLIQGENPFKYRFGAGVRIINLSKDEDRYPQGELGISFSEDVGPCLYLYDAKKEGDQIVSAGFQDDLGVVTGPGDTITEAIDEAYEYADKIGFSDIYYKSKDDFLSFSYPQSILNRLEYAVEKGLIRDDGISEEIRSQKYITDEKLRQESESNKQQVRDMTVKMKEKDDTVKKIKQEIRDIIKNG